MWSPKWVLRLPANWQRKGLTRILLLIGAAFVLTALASYFGVARDYSYLRASLLTGSPGGRYHALGTSLAARASVGHGELKVVPTAGSVDNVNRLVEHHERCPATFAFVQDGTPVPVDAQIEVLGRLPDTESLLLLGQKDRTFPTFGDLRGASIGIGPEGSGTSYLMRQLFEDRDLRELNVRLSQHELAEQIELVAKGQLDLAAAVMGEDAEFIRNAVHKYDLDIAAPLGLEGLAKRHPWLELGRIPAGRYDLERPTPSADRLVARVDTLVLANSCALRAERVALLTLLSAQLPGFVRGNPPRSTNSITALPLAPEARQFFVTGEPEIADRYFPWLVNLMSPVYWVYLVMAITVLFNAMRGYSRFRLWRIDAARERLKTAVNELTDPESTRERTDSSRPIAAVPDAWSTAPSIMSQLSELRARCQRYTGSLVTPMGDEMFYRYQESLINELMTALAAVARVGDPFEPPARTSDGRDQMSNTEKQTQAR